MKIPISRLQQLKIRQYITIHRIVIKLKIVISNLWIFTNST